MSTREFYRSEGEASYLAKRAEERKEKAAYITAVNTMLVGEIKEYKGIRYQMNQRGNYVCLDLPPLSGLDGAFTSTHILHSIIDKMESDGVLQKSKANADK